ncbi:MAG: hypothetical protein R3277_02560 [Brumimicrobium sp.]|nr:hypothetical protein [Brumimicrobium sp.]
MKKLLFIASFLVFGSLSISAQNSQEINVPVEEGKFSYEQLDTLTKIFLNNQFSSEELETLKNDPLKLRQYDYLCSKSFEIKSGQIYSLEDYLKIDVSIYDNIRTESTIVEVQDEASGLTLLLDSTLEAMEKLGAFFPQSTPTPAPTSKIIE